MRTETEKMKLLNAFNFHRNMIEVTDAKKTISLSRNRQGRPIMDTKELKLTPIIVGTTRNKRVVQKSCVKSGTQ